jgi:hypothetical protein
MASAVMVRTNGDLRRIETSFDRVDEDLAAADPW